MELEQKSMAVSEIETGAKGEFTADVAVFGNVDRVGDRILEGAFSKAIANDPPPPLIYNHQHGTPPIGETVEWKQTGKSLRIKGQLFVDGDDDHPVARMVHAGMKSRGGRPPALRDFSFVYGVPDGGMTMKRENAKSIRELSEIRPVAEIGPALLGVNPLAGTLMAPKGVLLEEKAEWTENYIGELPNRSFLHVDGDARLYPCRDAKGKLDIARLREAAEAKSDELSAEVVIAIRKRASDLMSIEQSKSMVLASLEMKAWSDIDGYCVSQMLDMLDEAVSYIQSEDEPANVAKMQTVARTLLGMLDGEFAELDDFSAAYGKSLWLSCSSFYMKAILPSDERVTVGSVASLLLAL